MASIIFALIALEDLHGEVDQALALIGMTVLLSVLAHGMSAKPLATRYGAATADSAAPAETELIQPTVRGLQRHPAPGSPRTSGGGAR